MPPRAPNLSSDGRQDPQRAPRCNSTRPRAVPRSAGVRRSSRADLAPALDGVVRREPKVPPARCRRRSDTLSTFRPRESAGGTLHVTAGRSDGPTQTSSQPGIRMDLGRRPPLVEESGEWREVVDLRSSDHRSGELVDEHSTIGFGQQRRPWKLIEQRGAEGFRGVHRQVPKRATDGRIRLGALVISIGPGQPERGSTSATQQNVTSFEVLDHRLRLAQQIGEGVFDHSHDRNISELPLISPGTRRSSPPRGPPALLRRRGMR